MISGLADDIGMPERPSCRGIDFPDPDSPVPVVKDLFAEKKRKGWGKSGHVARADITKYRLHYSQHNARAGFFSCWRKSVMGPALADLKADDDMIPVFAAGTARMIVSVLGSVVSPDSWAIVSAPRRRHRERNFAHLVAGRIAREIGIPFFADCALASSRMRIGAVFEAGNIPPQPNLIVYDDIVTTGSTINSMKNLLEPLGKTVIFFASIDNS